LADILDGREKQILGFIFLLVTKGRKVGAAPPSTKTGTGTYCFV
jgi:hypothetical protein